MEVTKQKPRKKPDRVKYPPPGPDVHASEVLGARCPHCDALDMRTLKTEHRGYRKTYRQRQCWQCERADPGSGKWWTIETSGRIATPDEVADIEFKLSKASREAISG